MEIRMKMSIRAKNRDRRRDLPGQMLFPFLANDGDREVQEANTPLAMPLRGIEKQQEGAIPSRSDGMAE